MNDTKETHVIIFKDRSHKIISNHQHEVVNSPQANKVGRCSIGGNLIDLKSIARTCTLKEFYKTYPAMRPAVNQYPSNYDALEAPKNRFTREENVQRMKDAALKSKKAERAKYGKQSWSTPLSDFELKRITVDGEHDCQSNNWKMIEVKGGEGIYKCEVCSKKKIVTKQKGGL